LAPRRRNASPAWPPSRHAALVASPTQ